MDLQIFKKSTSSKKWLQIHLSKEDPILRLNPQCEKISCVQGSLWVTSPSLGVDKVMSAGETMDLANQKDVIIEALGEADIGLFTQWH